MPARVFSSPWFLALIALLLLAAECLMFHFSFWVALHAVDIITVVLIPLFIVEALCIKYKLELDSHAMLSMSVALGFPLAALLISRLPFFFDSVFIWLLLAPLNRRWNEWMVRFMAADDITQLRTTIPGVDIRPAAITLWKIFISTALFLAIYNLPQFHYTSDGGIVWHGLFGVDIPFLAGQVHSLRNFGELHDLHQSAQPWHYHDATYRLLARFYPENTLGDIAFAAPLAGYTLLALSVFALVLHVTKERTIAWFAVLACFVASGWAGLDTSSYALSPSFVFGSILLVNIILVLDIARERTGASRIILLSIALLLTIVLAETKITSFLVLIAVLMLMAAIKAIRRSWRSAFEYAIISILPLIVVALISKTDPLMPAGDFLVGAPLMGYANHVAAMLHTSVAAVNPVTHATLSVRSLLILPYFVFHFVRFVALDPRLLAALLVIILIRPKSELGILLALIVPLGFFMPVLYSPAWYPLALSFYAPLVSTQAAILLVAIEWRQISRRRVSRVAIACLFGFSMATGLYQIVKADRAKATTINLSFVTAMDSVAANVPEHAIFVSRRHDLKAKDESYYWYSALSGRSVVSEGAKYGSLLGAVADVDPEKGLHRILAAESLLAQRRFLIDSVYLSKDANVVLSAIGQLHSSYVLLDHQNGDSITLPPRFDTLFSNEAITLLKIHF